jgi:hypothetical protein
MKLRGKLEFQDLEGGVFELAAEDGRRYTLLGRKSELHAAEGKRVEVEGEIEDGFGIAMRGPQVRVEKLRKI